LDRDSPHIRSTEKMGPCRAIHLLQLLAWLDPGSFSGRLTRDRYRLERHTRHFQPCESEFDDGDRAAASYLSSWLIQLSDRLHPANSQTLAARPASCDMMSLLTHILTPVLLLTSSSPPGQRMSHVEHTVNRPVLSPGAICHHLIAPRAVPSSPDTLPILVHL